jgi:RimJ/RimL family protein N-acetyltransferase
MDADAGRQIVKDIFTGRLVRLAAVDAEEASRAKARWWRDSEFSRMLDGSLSPLRSQRASRNWVEEALNDLPLGDFWFSIRTLEGNRLIGDIDISVVYWLGRDAFVGLGIGEREYWDRGYGTDAMNVILRYAFEEANLDRVSLTVFEYNARAIRSYEKAGFRHEGRFRKYLNRDGKRWDMLVMGILRDEWMELQTST